MRLGNFFGSSADHKKPVHRKQNVEIGSAASSGGQGNYSFPWPALETALSVCKVRMLNYFFDNILVKTKENAISAKS